MRKRIPKPGPEFRLKLKEKRERRQSAANAVLKFPANCLFNAGNQVIDSIAVHRNTIPISPTDVLRLSDL